MEVDVCVKFEHAECIKAVVYISLRADVPVLQ